MCLSLPRNRGSRLDRGEADNRVGIVGIAPAATLMALRACWENQDEPGALCAALRWPRRCSGCSTIRHRCSTRPGQAAGQASSKLIEKAIDQGITVVGAVDPDHPEDSFFRDTSRRHRGGLGGTAIAVGGEILGPGSISHHDPERELGLRVRELVCCSADQRDRCPDA
jgi:hypothetical protein